VRHDLLAAAGTPVGGINGLHKGRWI
jgi:hypothetical protein